MSKVLKWAVALVTAFAFGALATYFPLKRHFKAKLDALKPTEVQVIKRDTITAYFPIEIEKRIIERDSVFIRTEKHDTIWMPREQKVYADSSFRAVVSGIEPRLDSIEVYNKTIIQTKISIQKEWRKFDYGIQLGVGIVQPINGNPNFGAYAGFGITYHF